MVTFSFEISCKGVVGITELTIKPNQNKNKSNLLRSYSITINIEIKFAIFFSHKIFLVETDSEFSQIIPKSSPNHFQFSPNRFQNFLEVFRIFQNFSEFFQTVYHIKRFNFDELNVPHVSFEN